MSILSILLQFYINRKDNVIMDVLLWVVQNCFNRLKAFLREYDRIVIKPIAFPNAKVYIEHKIKC